MAESQLSLHARTKPNYRKHFVPLESDPQIFTDLIRKLGVKGYEFQDVLSLDDPDLLSFIPRPVVGLVFIFPPTDAWEKQFEELESKREVYEGKGEDEPIVWFAQTIQNACGLYALLHAVSNGIRKEEISAGSPLDNLLKESVPLGPYERALALENSNEIAAAHAAAGAKGSTAPPDATDTSVEHHYTCFVRSNKNNHIYELNGTAKGPIDTGIVQETNDMLSEKGIKLIKDRLEQGGGNVTFSLLGLVAV